MKTLNRPKVIFYRVKDNSTKIQLICLKAQEAIQQEKRLLITVSTLEAAHYIDTLLWRFPEEGFIPHVVTDNPTAEWIAITLQNEKNINQATRLLNLTSQPISFYQQMEEVYEIYDETQAQKLELSQQRLSYYQAQKINVKQEDVSPK